VTGDQDLLAAQTRPPSAFPPPGAPWSCYGPKPRRPATRWVDVQWRHALGENLRSTDVEHLPIAGPIQTGDPSARRGVNHVPMPARTQGQVPLLSRAHW
jgi:hypothetical protein